MLSRYVCYLIVQNGDPRKEIIAIGQTYFAVKTRQQIEREHKKDGIEIIKTAPGVGAPETAMRVIGLTATSPSHYNRIWEEKSSELPKMQGGHS